MRWDFWRTANVPKDESFTVSPRGERAADFFEHVLDHLGRFVAGQADRLEHRLGQVGAGQCVRCHGKRLSLSP